MHVIARAYRDKPLDRIVVQADSNLIYLADPQASRAAIDDEKTGVGFPVSSIFKFDAALYDMLLAAWTKGDDGELRHLWDSAEPQAAHG